MNEAARPALAVLISGRGTNLQALIDAAAAGRLSARIACVFSDRSDAPGLARAERAGVTAEVLTGPEPGRRRWEAPLEAALDRHRPDLIVLAGFMRILSPAFTARWHGRILNLHPSLLPAYRGLDTHARVLAAGDTHHGASVHFVTAALDAGPVVIQYRLSLRPGDTPQTLADRVQAGEHEILPRAVEWFAAGRLRLEGERVMLDGKALAGPVVVEES